MRFWPWLFRRRTPRRAVPLDSPYRMAPDKLPGAPPPEPPEPCPAPAHPPVQAIVPDSAAIDVDKFVPLLAALGVLALIASAGVSRGARPSSNASMGPPVLPRHPPSPASLKWGAGIQAPESTPSFWGYPQPKYTATSLPSPPANDTVRSPRVAPSKSDPAPLSSVDPAFMKLFNTPAPTVGSTRWQFHVSAPVVKAQGTSPAPAPTLFDGAAISPTKWDLHVAPPSR
jgi:hypothetical protein